MNRWRRDDAGAYAILYGVTMVLLIGVAALVVDLGMARLDRRTDRSAADAAAIQGANKLGFSGTSPRLACQAAIQYAGANLGVNNPSTTACNGFPSSAVCTSTTAPITVTATIKNKTIYVRWPVADTQLSPDLERWSGVVTTQPAGPQDRTQCARIAVAIETPRTTGLGIVSGAGNVGSTLSYSIAVAAIEDGPGEMPVPLVVLDPHSCNALTAGGGGATGGLVVRASLDGQFPGGIAVDSDAEGGEDGCNGGATPIDVSNNSYIWALDAPSGPTALLRSYAKSIGLPDSRVYDAGTLGCTTPWRTTAPADEAGHPDLCPIPSPLSFPRVTSRPWVNRYNCTSECTEPFDTPLPTPRDYIDQWVRYATGPTPEAFVTKKAGGDCVLGTGVYDDVFSSCSTLTVTGTAVVTGQLVARGNVRVEGCLLVGNVTDTAWCGSIPPYLPANLRGADHEGIYIGGDLVVSNASLVTNQSLLYLRGRFDINNSAGPGIFALTAPYGRALSAQPACVPSTNAVSAPSPACFESMALWSPYAGTEQGNSRNQLQGQTQVEVDGTLFTPNAYFFYAGQAANDQERAQFVTRRLEITGGGRLTMTPDANRGTNIPGTVGQLIR